MKHKRIYLCLFILRWTNRRFDFRFECGGTISSIWITAKHGNANATVYWYADDKTNVYLANLNVGSAYRKRGIGTMLLKLSEKTARNIGAGSIRLCAKRTSCVYGWCKNHGYNVFSVLEKSKPKWEYI